MKREHVIRARVHIIVGFLLAAFCIFMACKAGGAPAPVLRLNLASYTTATRPEIGATHTETYTNRVYLLAYIGEPTIPDARVWVWTTSSMSPHVLDPEPWSEIGDYSDTWPVWALPFRDADGKPVPGWIVVPVRQLRINMPTGSTSWILDVNMRAVIYIAPPGCNVPACGAEVVMSRTNIASIATLPTPPPAPARRRAVAP